MVIPNHHLVTPNQNPTQTQQTLYICCVNWSKTAAIVLPQPPFNCNFLTTSPPHSYFKATLRSSSFPAHSHTPRSFAGHSQIIPTSLPGHSQILGHHQFIPSSFLVYSQIIPMPIQVRSQVIPNLLPDFSCPVQRCLYRFVEYSRDSGFMVDLVSWTHQHINILKLGGPKKAASFPSYGNSRLRKSWK